MLSYTKYKRYFFLTVLCLSAVIVSCGGLGTESDDPVLSSEKDITTFSLLSEDNSVLTMDATGDFDGTAITVKLPLGSRRDSLVPAFTATGVSVTINGVEQTSRIGAVDFTSPVIYTVRAEDNSEKSYTVTLACENISITSEDIGVYLAYELVVPNSGILISNVSYYGANGQSGIVTGEKGLSDGIIMTSGLATGALLPDDSGSTSYDHNGPSYSLGNLLTSPSVSHDCAMLEITFDLAPGHNGICIEYLFGSEEYPESVGMGFNDGFGIFLSGPGYSQQNIAVDGEGDPININGPYFETGTVMLPPDNGLEYDGTTPRLVTSSPLTEGSHGNKLIIVVCDAVDGICDSGAIISRFRGIQF